jgi:hypothetical protein
LGWEAQAAASAAAAMAMLSLAKVLARWVSVMA